MASDVWLRRNIRQDVADGVYGDDVTYWEADEAHGVLPGVPTVEYVTGRFAQLWSQFEEADLTDRELLELRADTLGDGLAEVAGISAENAEMLEVFAGAIEEMASDLYGGGE